MRATLPRRGLVAHILMNLGPAPEPLTSRQRTIFLLVAVICAATRFLARAQTLWDWDEALFTLGLQGYDVAQHHPHPPGFPVYIAAAKLMRLVVADDFRALQNLNLIAAMLVFPAMFLFARELRLRFSTALAAATLFAFFPNVWFFGGGAFSDIPSVVLVLFAVTYLLRGAHDRKAYWIGTLLLALSVGIRPQNILVGLFPGIRASLRRRRSEVAIALLIGVAVVGLAFGGAALATGSFDRYLSAVTAHSEYISRVDSWRSPERPPLWRLFDRFFVKQYQSPALSVIASLLAMTSIAGALRERNRALLWNALTFGPFALLAWLMLDRFSISRFSIAWQPMFAVFVADGIRRVASAPFLQFLGARRGSSEVLEGSNHAVFAEELRGTPRNQGISANAGLVELALSAVLVLAFAAYTLPELGAVRREVAPSIAAARAVREHVDVSHEQLLVGHNMTVFLDLVAPDVPYTPGIDDRSQPLGGWDRTWLLAEVDAMPEGGFVFRRDRGHLWNIARRHYFEIKLQPLETRPRFVSGWYGAERGVRGEWRWMGRESRMDLPPVEGRAELRLELGVPRELLPQKPTVTVRVDGAVIDRFQATLPTVEKRYAVTTSAGGNPTVLELATDRTIATPEDRRPLGLRLLKLGWGRE